MAKRSSKNKSKELEGSKAPFSFKKHIMPPLAGLMITAIFVAAFNSQVIAGAFFKTHYNAEAEQYNVQLEAKPIDESAPSKIIINNVSIEAPINFDQKVIDETSFQVALRDGVVHYPNTALPGETGNVVIFGHSSMVWWAKGSYKYVFAPLHDLQDENKIYIEYKGTRYIYKVTNKKVVDPDNVSVLAQGKSKKLTLITCTPVGTSTSRLVIEAEQIAPNYTTEDLAEPAQKSPSELEALPSSAPSFWDSITDLF